MEELTKAEAYLKAVIEAYATQPGTPYELPIKTVKRITRKIIELFLTPN